VIAFCGVWFMAETAKVVNPAASSWSPTARATCSLVEAVPWGRSREFRLNNPDYVIVSLHQTIHRGEGPKATSSAPRATP